MYMMYSLEIHFRIYIYTMKDIYSVHIRWFNGFWNDCGWWLLVEYGVAAFSNIQSTYIHINIHNVYMYNKI